MFHFFSFGNRFFAFIFISFSILTTTAFANSFDPKWDEPRRYYIDLIEAGCAGDQGALDKILNDYSSGNLSREAAAVAAHQLAWSFHPINECPPMQEFKSLERWEHWVRRGAAGGYPSSLYSLGRSLVEGSDDVIPDRVTGLRLLKRAVIDGSSLSAMILARYYASSDYGLIPDKFFAGGYAARAVFLKGSGRAVEKSREIAASMPRTEVTSAIVLQRLQGRWEVEDRDYNTTKSLPFVEITGNSLKTYLERFNTEDFKQSYQISIDHPKCIDANVDHRLWYDGKCFDVEFGNENRIFISHSTLFGETISQAWRRVY